MRGRGKELEGGSCCSVGLPPVEAVPEHSDLVRALRFMRGFVVKGCLNKPFTRALKDEGNCLLDHRESSSEVYGNLSAPGPGHFTNFFC